VYLFDAAGALLEARIDDLGLRSEVDEDAARALLEKRVAELGALSYEDIEVQPFSLQRFETTFGMIPRPPDDDDDAEMTLFDRQHPLHKVVVASACRSATIAIRAHRGWRSGGSR
jgi:hypothetical protein